MHKNDLNFDIGGKVVVKSKIDLLEATPAESPFYVYILAHPPVSPKVTPFYVGIGCGERVFAHEDATLLENDNSRKANTIRKIWKSNNQIVRVIDGFFEERPYLREGELINKFGLVKDGTGILTNEQRYSESTQIDGVELRKYADLGNDFPSNFNYIDKRLAPGAMRPKSTQSVYGIIYATLEENPGVTGRELVALLLRVDFSKINSPYTQSEQVSIPWLTGYITGGFRKDKQHIQLLDNRSD